MASTRTVAMPRLALLGGWLAVGLLGGCAGDNARLMALQTLKTVTEYEQQIDRKVTAEKAFYADQMTTLSDSLAGPPAQPGGQSSDDAFERSWLYGRIRVSAEADARKTAGRILSSDDGDTLSLISDFVGRGLEVNRTLLIEVSAQRTVLTRQVAESLRPLEKQKARLSSLRKGLATLTAEPSAEIRLAPVKAFAEAVLKELRTNQAE